MNSTIDMIGLFLQTAVQMGTPILFATVGGILSEKAGHLNLGVEGMMLMGAVMGFQVGVKTGSAAIAILAAGLSGLIGALVYAIITVTFRGNQTVTGLALTIFGTGVSGFIGKALVGVALPESLLSTLRIVEIPVLKDIPILGNMLFKQSIYVHIGIIIAILAYVFFKKTSIGLNLRAVGENPGSADASGVNVTAYKYASILTGGFLCGLGGAFLSLVFVPRWQDNITAGIGWIAVALIIFCTWNPLRAIFGAYFFGVLRSIPYKIQNLSIPFFGASLTLPAQLLDMLPYIMTIVVLVFITSKKRKSSQAPASLGTPYFREDR